MFSGKFAGFKRKKSQDNANLEEAKERLTKGEGEMKTGNGTQTKPRSNSRQNGSVYEMANRLEPIDADINDSRKAELVQFLDDTRPEDHKYDRSSSSLSRRPRLAKAETIEEDPAPGLQTQQTQSGAWCVNPICRAILKRWPLLILLLILSCIAAIYCLPFVDVDAGTPKRRPHIPFNFNAGPLRAAKAEHFRAERLFSNQIYGAESMALDSQANMYLAVEGGFILYAHLNASSTPNRAFFNNKSISAQDYMSINQWPTSDQQARVAKLTGSESNNINDLRSQYHNQLVKIAELNPIKQIPFEQRRREWRRECQLDEKLYGKSLSSGGVSPTNARLVEASALGDNPDNKFVSRVVISRCSKPLGIRLSPDENYLYVIDTLSGLYRVHLKESERPQSSQRVVSRLLDFRNQRHQLLPVTFLDLAAGQAGANLKREATNEEFMEPPMLRVPTQMNVSLFAVDDLVIDFGAGGQGSDIIYMTLGSQNWPAVGAMYDLLEGRPSGAVLRFDVGFNQLSVMSPNQVAHVRTSALGVPQFPLLIGDQSIEVVDDGTMTPLIADGAVAPDNSKPQSIGPPYAGIGAPRLDANDIFDDRPFHFANGIEMTDDRQALLIADTGNKRIVKHFIRGPRKGTSDLWAWTPNFPDNIRRGYDKHHETYWVAGCGEDTTGKFDVMDWLHSWPRLRKYLLKNIYFFGWLVESIGYNLLGSNKIRDFGYSMKIGHSLCEKFCPGMMILQYNANGDVIRSIYSKEFPNDLVYYSQANEVVDHENNEHFLYLGSPSYDYVTRLFLPRESPDLPVNNII